MRGIYQFYKEKHLHRYWRNTISDTIIASSLVITMENVRQLQSKIRLANVSRTNKLTSPNFRIQAGRFIRWRKRRG